MPFRTAIRVVLLAPLFLAAAPVPDSLKELITRAESARPEDKPALYFAIAQREFKAADQLYKDGKLEEARAAVRDVVSYSEKAHDAALQSGKKIKDTEIALRKLAAKLRDLKRSLNFEDQEPVQTAADRLESLRTDLLSHMFAKGK